MQTDKTKKITIEDGKIGFKYLFCGSSAAYIVIDLNDPDFNFEKEMHKAKRFEHWTECIITDEEDLHIFKSRVELNAKMKRI